MAAATYVRGLYDQGGDLPEWTVLDEQELLDDTVQGEVWRSTGGGSNA